MVTSKIKFTARYSVYYYLLYVLLPQAAGQMVVQMRVPKISLANGLQAQISADFCR